MTLLADFGLNRFTPLTAVKYLLRFCLLFVATLPAVDGQTVNSVSVLNHSGAESFLIASDRDNPEAGYNRDTIHAQANVFYPSDINQEYELRFTLRDEAGQAVPLRNEHGAVTNYIPVTVWTGFNAVTRSDEAHLRPAGRLDFREAYAARVEVYYWSFISARWYKATEADEPSFRAYYHFTNLSSKDPALNVIARLNEIAFSRIDVINTVPGRDRLATTANITLMRYDGFDEPTPPSDSVTVHVDYEMRESGSNRLVAFASARHTFARSVSGWTSRHGVRRPVDNRFTRSVSLQLAPGEQLDPVNRHYELSARISHVDEPGTAPVIGNSLVHAPQRLLHFNGTLRFGSIETTFTRVANEPTVLAVETDHVVTSLAVSELSGRIGGSDSHRYGDGSALDVRLRANGDAELATGMVLVDAPEPDRDSIGGITYDRTISVLDSGGLHAAITSYLPGGAGWNPNRNVSILFPMIGFEMVAMGQDLSPQASSLVWAPVHPVYFTVENMPLWLRVPEIVWDVSAGTFEMVPDEVLFVRTPYLDRLEASAGDLSNSDGALKRSNDHYLRAIAEAPGPVVVRPGPVGEAHLEAVFPIVSGSSVTHFPYDVGLAWTGGTAAFADGLFDTAGSALDGISGITVAYEQGCTGDDCGEGANLSAIQLFPEAGELRFTPHGGLHARAAPETTDLLAWGYMASGEHAHRIENPFAEARFYIPGYFLGEAEGGTLGAGTPPVMLLSGLSPDVSMDLHLPGTQAYLAGAGDYAGANFRLDDGDILFGRSRLSGFDTGIYPLTERSKYYARHSGITGIHAPEAGAVEGDADIFGYDLTIDHMELAFLSNEVVAAVTPGSLTLPYPAGFSLGFESLRFSCRGSLEGAVLRPEDEEKRLQYWDADIRILVTGFRAVDACDPGEGGGHLRLGVETHAAGFAAPLHGILGVFPDGNLVRAADAVEGLDSRLRLPSQLEITAAVGEETNYVLLPVGGAYLNHFPGSPEEVGFLNVPGRMRVAFFREMPVLLHLGFGEEAGTAPLHIMGGSWAAGSSHESVFDPEHRGFPENAELLAYRDTRRNRSYRPVARQNAFLWPLFNYPVVWDPVSRVFARPEAEKSEVIILRLENRVSYLSAERADIVFGIEYEGVADLQWPGFVRDLIREGEIGLLPVVRYVNEGFQSIGRMLSSSAENVVEFVLQVSERVGDLATQIGEAVASAVTREEVEDALDALAGEIRETLEETMGDSESGHLAGWHAALDGLEAALAAFIDEVDTDPESGESIEPISGWLKPDAVSGRRESAAAIFADYTERFDWAAEMPGLADTYLEQNEAVFLEAERILQRLLGETDAIRGALEEGGAIHVEISGIYAAFAWEIEEIADRVAARIRDEILAGWDEGRLPDADEIAQRLLREVEDEVRGSSFLARLNSTVHRHLRPIGEWMNKVTDTIADTVRNTIAPAARRIYNQLDDLLSAPLAEFLGEFDRRFSGAGLTGRAEIEQETLRRIRLEGKYALDFGQEIDYYAHLEFRQHRSEAQGNGSGTSVRGPEIVFGATASVINGGPFSMIDAEAHANVDGRIWLGDPHQWGSFVFPGLGLSGSVELAGEADLSFGVFSIPRLSFAFAVSAEEAYLTSHNRLFVANQELEGGFFFGVSQTLDPILQLDPSVAGLIGEAPFGGVYTSGRGVLNYGTSNCLLRMSAGAEIAAFAFFDEAFRIAALGGRMSAEASAELFCAVQATGRLTLQGALSGRNLILEGGGILSGSTLGIEFTQEVGARVRARKIEVYFR